MKRLYRILLITTFLFTAVVSFTYGEEPTKFIVIENNVNVRQEPTLESQVMASLTLGQYVEVIDNEEEWYCIKLEGEKVGWVLNDLLLPIQEDKDFIKKGIVTGDKLNVRQQPSKDSPAVASLDKGIEVTIVESADGWYSIILNEQSTGWIHADYVEVKPNYSTGRIKGDHVNLRQSPSIDAQVLAKLRIDSIVSVKGYQDGWMNIITQDNVEGWISKDYIDIVLDTEASASSVSRSANRSAGFAKITDFAQQYLGVPYKWGASSPSGFDCSGFTSYVFKNFGISLARRSSDQAKQGEKVSKSELKPGDLVFFDTSGANNGNITHVGIYIGDGKFIHASSGKNAKKVVISSLAEGYYNEKYVTARRIFS
ncbi:MAG: SH3 domain-containing protein [Bacillota bacterium]